METVPNAAPSTVPYARRPTPAGQGNLLDPECGTRRVLDLVADKWKLTIVCALHLGGVARFSELERQVPGVTQKMLTQTLRGLERDGVVERTVHPVVPPRVEYRLTPLGRSLRASLDTLLGWAHDHLAEVDAARDRFRAASVRGAP